MIELRLKRLKVAQDEERWILGVKHFIQGDLTTLDAATMKEGGKVAGRFVVDEVDLLHYFPDHAATASEHPRLVVPETLQRDLLHHYHSSCEGY